MDPQDRSDTEELAAWLRLAATNGVGPAAGRRLLSAFGLPLQVFDADSASIEAAAGTPSVARALLRPDAQRERSIEQSLRWLEGCGEAPRTVLTLADPRYPPRLLHLADPPLVLHVEGAVQALSRPQIAIVGSRNATALGASTSADLAAALAGGGWTIVSGLAEGIDRAAHLGALDGASGDAALDCATVAVMGTGIDRVYPSRHRGLAREIAMHGALVSEQPIGAVPRPGHFPRRNRLIAALAHGVLVVEAALRSGSLITARLAADLGREVFAVPGSIHSPQSRGCHWLIRQGAALVETVQDIRHAFPGSLGPADGAARVAAARTADVRAQPVANGEDPAAPPLRALLDALDGGPSTVDMLQSMLDWPIGSLLAALQKLEFDGRVGSGDDGRWYRAR